MFFLCRGYFSGWPSPVVLMAFAVSLVMAFVLGFFLEACIGMIGFWFLEVNSLLFVYMLFNYFLSGQMFPLEFFDKIMLVGTVSLGTLIRLLPFKYLCYFPCAVFLEKITGSDLVEGLLVEVGWVVFFICLAHWLFNRGVRRYSAFGG